MTQIKNMPHSIGAYLKGVGVESVELDANNHLIVHLDNGETVDAGEFKVDDELDAESTRPLANKTLSSLFSAVNERINTLVGGNATEAIDNLNEIIAFLQNFKDSETLASTLAEINNAIAKELQKKVDKVEGKGLSTNDYTDEDKAQVAEIEGKQDTLTLTVKDNGNIVIGNIAGQTKEFMPATPSGDPMHYYYLSHFGVTYNESTGFFELEYLKDLTANDMRNAVRVSGDTRWLYNEANSVGILVANEDRPRTNIAMLSGTIQASDRNDFPKWCRALEQWIIGKCSAISFATLTNVYDSTIGIKLHLAGLDELRYIVGVIDISTLSSRVFHEMFRETVAKLQEVRLKNLNTSQTIKFQKDLSKGSISYLLSNRINTEEISLSLPAELYNKIMTDGGEWADLRTLCEATTDKGRVILELNA